MHTMLASCASTTDEDEEVVRMLLSNHALPTRFTRGGKKEGRGVGGEGRGRNITTRLESKQAHHSLQHDLQSSEHAHNTR